MLTILSCTIDLLNSRLENFDFFFRKYDDDFFLFIYDGKLCKLFGKSLVILPEYGAKANEVEKNQLLFPV